MTDVNETANDVNAAERDGDSRADMWCAVAIVFLAWGFAMHWLTGLQFVCWFKLKIACWFFDVERAALEVAFFLVLVLVQVHSQNRRGWPDSQSLFSTAKKVTKKAANRRRRLIATGASRRVFCPAVPEGLSPSGILCTFTSAVFKLFLQG